MYKLAFNNNTGTTSSSICYINHIELRLKIKTPFVYLLKTFFFLRREKKFKYSENRMIKTQLSWRKYITLENKIVICWNDILTAKIWYGEKIYNVL